MSAIEFLGKRSRTSTRSCKSWSAGSPGAFDYIKTSRPGVYQRRGDLRLESLYPIVAGYKDSEALGLHPRTAIPSASARSSIAASYIPTTRCLEGRAPLTSASSTSLAGIPGSTGMPTTSTTCSGPPRRAAGATRGSWNDRLVYDNPRFGEIESTAESLLGRSRHAAGLPEHPVSHREAHHRVDRARATTSTQVDRRRRRREGDAGSRSSTPTAPTDVSPASSPLRPRVPAAARPLVDLAAKRRRPRPATWTTRSRISSSAASATTTSTTQDQKRYREMLTFPGSRSTRSAAGTSSSRWSSGTYRRCASQRRQAALYMNWLRPALFAGGALTNSRTGPSRDVYNVGVQFDLQVQVMHACP